MTSLVRPYGSVVSDGESLIVNWGNNSAKLFQPVVTSLSFSTNPITYRTGGGITNTVAGPIEVHGEFTACGGEWFNGNVPDVESLVEQMTVRELFAVVEKKLKTRQT